VIAFDGLFARKQVLDPAERPYPPSFRVRLISGDAPNCMAVPSVMRCWSCHKAQVRIKAPLESAGSLAGA